MSTFGREADALAARARAREPSRLVVRCASEIELEHVEWLWPGRLALGKHTCIAGDPGTGKSQLSTAIAATVTIGGVWPCDEGRSPQGGVIILSAEDGAGDTIVPRLYAADADCGRVHIVNSVQADCRRSFTLQTDLELLENKIRELGDVALVCIDPISSYLGKTELHKNAEVRGVLEPLTEMAERMRVAVLSVTHFSKGGANSTGKALHRFIGSIAFVGAPRMAFAVIEDADNSERRLLLHAKNNLAAPPSGLAYRLKQTIVGDGKGIAASRVDWEPEHVSITANEALAADAGQSPRPCEEAEGFLKELLADGPIPAKQVKSDADAAGLSWATIRRAKNRLALTIKREGFGPGSSILWAIPDTIDAQNSHRCSHYKVSTYAESEHLCEPDDYPDLPAFLDQRIKQP